MKNHFWSMEIEIKTCSVKIQDKQSIPKTTTKTVSYLQKKKTNILTRKIKTIKLP